MTTFREDEVNRQRNGQFGQTRRAEPGQIDFEGPRYQNPQTRVGLTQSIREDLREKKIPGCRLTVKTEGQFITVTVRDAEWSRWFTPVKDETGVHYWEPTPEWNELYRTVKDVTDQYNKVMTHEGGWAAHFQARLVTRMSFDERNEYSKIDRRLPSSLEHDMLRGGLSHSGQKYRRLKEGQWSQIESEYERKKAGQ